MKERHAREHVLRKKRRKERKERKEIGHEKFKWNTLPARKEVK